MFHRKYYLLLTWATRKQTCGQLKGSLITGLGILIRCGMCLFSNIDNCPEIDFVTAGTFSSTSELIRFFPQPLEKYLGRTVVSWWLTCSLWRAADWLGGHNEQVPEREFCVICLCIVDMFGCLHRQELGLVDDVEHLETSDHAQRSEDSHVCYALTQPSLSRKRFAAPNIFC
jgi:hypothetical protein